MNLMVFIVAVALAMDCLAVSVAAGLTRISKKVSDALKIATSFGSFQSIMALLGWTAGRNFIEFVAGIDHWVAFVLLASVGTRMVYGSTSREKHPSYLDLRSLLILSLATSIDALATGLCLTILDGTLTSSVATIGAVSFLLSFIGFYTGKQVEEFIGSKAEAIGGLTLIAIGLKTLIEHL